MLGKADEIDWVIGLYQPLTCAISHSIRRTFYRKGSENVQSRMLARVACHDLIRAR